MNRREFIQKSCKCALICATPLALTAIQSCEDSKADTDSSNQGETLNNFIEYNMNDAIYSSLKTVGNSIAVSSNSLDSRGFLLYRETNSFVKVFSRNCTHAGGLIGPFNNGKSRCDRHGAEFNTSGSPVSGPTSKSLKQYSAVIIGAIIRVSRS